MATEATKFHGSKVHDFHGSRVLQLLFEFSWKLAANFDKGMSQGQG